MTCLYVSRQPKLLVLHHSTAHQAVVYQQRMGRRRYVLSQSAQCVIQYITASNIVVQLYRKVHFCCCTVLDTAEQHGMRVILVLLLRQLMHFHEDFMFPPQVFFLTCNFCPQVDLLVTAHVTLS